MQFLLNGYHRPFANRWLDKPVQFAVTANGLSAGIYEHSKVDGMDVRTLHTHITRALFAQPSGELFTSSAHPVREYAWNLSPTITQRLEQVRLRLTLAYGFIDHKHVFAENLGLAFLQTSRAPSNATAHLTVLLAIYLVEGSLRPAWEVVSLATFARGRIDWVQTVSPAVRAFVEAAAAAGQDSDKARIRSLFDEAATTHSRIISAAARGHGYVNHLYALRGALTSDELRGSLPALFHSRAWDATRRGGPGQDLKIGFMPDHDPDQASVSWDEGGFLVEGERGIYVHCGVREHHIRFAVSASPSYASAVCDALHRAAATVAFILA